MPYWSYSVEQKGNARVDAESRSRRDGDYLVTEQYVIQGDIDISYDGYAHDASRAFDDEISECLAPFDTENRQTFTPGFLSGFYVDVADEPSGKYLDDAKTYYENLTARKLLRNEEILQTAKSQHIHTTDVTGVSIPTKITGIEQVLYPVWFLSYRDGDRITYASVNGQTGKVVADFPISKARFLLASLIVSALVFLMMSFFLTLKPECSLSVTSVLLVFGVWICSRQLTLLSERFSGRRFASKRASLLRAKRIAIVLTSIMLLISGGILLSAPVYNAVFYVPCFLEALLLFAMIARSFRTQMELATRRPPQFKVRKMDGIEGPADDGNVFFRLFRHGSSILLCSFEGRYRMAVRPITLTSSERVRPARVSPASLTSSKQFFRNLIFTSSRASRASETASHTSGVIPAFPT